MSDQPTPSKECTFYSISIGSKITCTHENTPRGVCTGFPCEYFGSIYSTSVHEKEEEEKVKLSREIPESIIIETPENTTIKFTPEVDPKIGEENLFFDPNKIVLENLKIEPGKVIFEDQRNVIKTSHLLGDSLDEAKTTITGERQDSYGSPEDSFALIAEYWNTYLNVLQKRLLIEHGFDLNDYELKPLLKSIDVTNLMVLFKMARTSGQRPSRDNYIDILGYGAIAADRFISQED